MIEIRKLHEQDAESYRALRVQALKQFPHAFAASAERAEKQSLQEVKERIKQGNYPERFVVGAFDEQQLVGMVGFFQQEAEKLRHKGYIWGMYTSPACQGQGVGKQMLAFVLEQAKALPDVEQIQLTVEAGNEPAKRLYNKMGFTPYAFEKQSMKVNGVYYDEEHMVRYL